MIKSLIVLDNCFVLLETLTATFQEKNDVIHSCHTYWHRADMFA